MARNQVTQRQRTAKDPFPTSTKKTTNLPNLGDADPIISYALPLSPRNLFIESLIEIG